MIGAIWGDIIGSRFEFHNIKTKNFRLITDESEFTDDTVATLAVAKALIECDRHKGREDYYELLSCETEKQLISLCREFPNAGYGGGFSRWLWTPDETRRPYNSFGNGSAMRVCPVGFYAKSIEEAEKLSEAVTRVTHNHPEGIKGAEATAVAIVMARQGYDKADIKKYIEIRYYELPYDVKHYRDTIKGHGDETCMVSMPQALTCFFEGKGYEDVMRNCVSIGGDSDTLCAIAGGIAEAYYGCMFSSESLCRSLPHSLAAIVEEFEELIK